MWSRQQASLVPWPTSSRRAPTGVTAQFQRETEPVSSKMYSFVARFMSPIMAVSERMPASCWNHKGRAGTKDHWDDGGHGLRAQNLNGMEGR